MLKKESVEIKLLGQRIVLKSSETDPEFVQQVVELVTRKVSLAEDRAKGAAPHQVTLLALLDVAEEYVRAKRRTSEYQRKMGEVTDNLTHLIEAELK